MSDYTSESDEEWVARMNKKQKKAYTCESDEDHFASLDLPCYSDNYEEDDLDDVSYYGLVTKLDAYHALSSSQTTKSSISDEEEDCIPVTPIAYDIAQPLEVPDTPPDKIGASTSRIRGHILHTRDLLGDSHNQNPCIPDTPPEKIGVSTSRIRGRILHTRNLLSDSHNKNPSQDEGFDSDETQSPHDPLG